MKKIITYYEVVREIKISSTRIEYAFLFATSDEELAKAICKDRSAKYIVHNTEIETED